MMTNFLLLKIGKIAVYIGPYRMAFNDVEKPIISEEDC